MSVYSLNKAEYGTHRIISRLLGRGKTVLDIGCNKGYLYDIAPDNLYYGIDYDSKDLKEAKKKYLNVYRMDLNTQYTSFEKKLKFDAIVFADILEHLLHPQDILTFFVKNNLKKNGDVIVSLPNVAHLSIRLKLLFGSFTYTESGILDKTHLHLYTKKTAEKLINDSGLKVEETLFSSNIFGKFIKYLPFLGPFLGFNLIFRCRRY